MAMTEQLRNIMSAQADLMDALTETLAGTQQALLKSDSDALVEYTEREESLLRPFHDLEYERERCVRELAGPGRSMADLLALVSAEERAPLESLARRMGGAAKRIIDLNGQNRVLIRNAQRFVQETLRIITDDHRRKLVDERM
jgi:flagellar biosynthesis/type III secretory pathway chaperone